MWPRLVRTQEDVLAQFVKMKSIELCSNTVGQLSVGLMVRPPSADAKALYDKEVAEVLAGLRVRDAVATPMTPPTLPPTPPHTPSNRLKHPLRTPQTPSTPPAPPVR